MAFFKLTAHDDSVIIVVAAKCLTCARRLAADAAGKEGPRMWLDSAKSTCAVLHENMAPQIITRSISNE